MKELTKIYGKQHLLFKYKKDNMKQSLSHYTSSGRQRSAWIIIEPFYIFGFEFIPRMYARRIYNLQIILQGKYT